MQTNLSNLSGSELVSYNNLGTPAVNGCSIVYSDFYHYYPVYYPSYQFIRQDSKIEQAFKIVGKLIEKDFIEKELTVKQFMKIVNEIAEII